MPLITVLPEPLKVIPPAVALPEDRQTFPPTVNVPLVRLLVRMLPLALEPV